MSTPFQRVHPGYKIAKDERNLTQRQREVMGWLAQGYKPTDAAKQMGLTRQRVGSIVKTLVEKGYLVYGPGRALSIVVSPPHEKEDDDE